MKTMRVLNGSGDIVIGWENPDDEAVKAWIQKMMDDGIVFFVLNKQGKPEVLRDIGAQDLATRQVRIFDTELDKLAVDAKVKVMRGAGANDFAPTHRAKTAADVAANDTVGFRRAQGG